MSDLFGFYGPLPELDELSSLWEPDPPMSERLNPTPLVEFDPAPGAWLRNKLTNKDVLCTICDHNGGWLPEGAAWVCDHGTLEFFPIRIIGSVPMSEVYACNPTTGELIKVEEV